MEKLFEHSQQKLQSGKTTFKRYLYSNINWNSRLICIKGARGVGKTTLMIQRMKDLKADPHEMLYISLDDFYFSNYSLLETAEQFSKSGGRYLFIDEVHKYPSWSREIKNIFDFNEGLNVVFSGSSLLEITKGEGDLSRRSLNYDLHELSLREFIALEYDHHFNEIKLSDLFSDHTKFAENICKKIKPIAAFKNYLREGCYPYYYEDKENYQERLAATINYVIETDLPGIQKIDYYSIIKIKKLLYIIAESVPFKPNISELALKTGMTRTTVLFVLDYLERASIIQLLKSSKKGMSQLAKPEKIYLRNPNIYYALAQTGPEAGNLRETFFMNQLSALHTVNYSEKGDFLIDNKFTIEVGGKDKNIEQIKDIKNSYIAADNIEFGYKNKIPLWLFGFTY